MAVVLGLTGWLAMNFSKIDLLLKCGCLVVIVASSLFAYTRFKRLYQLLQEIEDA
jgi:hypothetical protein